VRYNIGVACINMQLHREAAQHFLAALALQSDQSPTGGTAETQVMSETIW
jgi:peroxin-5